MNECPYCSGKGEMFAFVNGGEDILTHRSGIFKCDQCKGAGKISDEHFALYTSGKQLRDDRVKAGISLMEMARQKGISPAQLSNIERGRIPPIFRG